MNKNTLILLIASLVGTQVWAGSVTVPNTFSDGTTASAGEVNANFDSVESAVNDNNTRITNNTSNALTNTANISTNTTSIQNNANNIGLNAAGVTTNAGEISANSTNIGINAADIATNVLDIQNNATNIQEKTDTLASLNCSNQQIAKYDSQMASWICADPPTNNDYVVVDGNNVTLGKVEFIESTAGAIFLLNVLGQEIPAKVVNYTFSNYIEIKSGGSFDSFYFYSSTCDGTPYIKEITSSPYVNTIFSNYKSILPILNDKSYFNYVNGINVFNEIIQDGEAFVYTGSPAPPQYLGYVNEDTSIGECLFTNLPNPVYTYHPVKYSGRTYTPPTGPFSLQAIP